MFAPFLAYGVWLIAIINRCKSIGYFVVVGVVSCYGEESKEEAG